MEFRQINSKQAPSYSFQHGSWSLGQTRDPIIHPWRPITIFTDQKKEEE